jgi:BirA family biotin operon repressor/biotin-[acetyl-CoA-carboxylase] ligase
MQYLPLITLMTGVAVHDTLAELGIDADIKWVNDLHVDGKKICGILAETTDTPKGLAVIVGIGINIKPSNFPPEIADAATSIKENVRVTPLGVETAEAVTLTQALTKFLTYFYAILQSDDGPTAIIDEWRKRSTYFSGKPVRVVLENETLTGVTDGLEPNGALRVKRNDGSITIVQAGDVEQLRTT